MRLSADIPPHRDFWIKSDIRLPGDASISGWARESLLSYAEGSADADHGLQRLIDWAKARQRPTVTTFFGDHLPPLGPVYVETGFLKDNVAPRKQATAEATLEHHNTPLVIGSNRSGPIEQDAYRFASRKLHLRRALDAIGLADNGDEGSGRILLAKLQAIIA